MQTKNCYSTSHCSCCKLVNRFTIELNSLEVTLKKSVIIRNGGPTRPQDFLKQMHAKEERNGPPSANQGLFTIQPSPEAAMLFVPFGCTQPPPPVLPFLLV